MAPKERSSKVSHSFSRVLIIAYLLCVGRPSSAAVVMPKDCLDTDIILELVGYGSVKAWAKISQCVTKIFEDTFLLECDTAKQFQRLYDTTKLIKEKVEAVLQNHPTQSKVFDAFAISLYLATLAFDLYWRELPELLENAEEYRREIGHIYHHEVVSVLEDINALLQNWQEYKIEKTTKHILAMLEAITNNLSDFLQKIKVDQLKVIENEGVATVVCAVSGAVAVGSAVIAFAFPPAGAVLASRYIATIGVGSVTAVAIISYKTILHFVELEKQLAKLQDKTYKYRSQIAAGKRKINKILMKSYRSKRPRSNRG